MGDECFDFILGEFACGGLATEFPFQAPAFSLDLGNPSGGDGDVAVVFEECPVLGQLGVAFFELGAQLEVAVFVVIGLAGLGQSETYRMVRVPVTASTWSTWKRYCDSAGISMGRAIAAMIDRELVSVFGESAGDPSPVLA